MSEPGQKPIPKWYRHERSYDVSVFVDDEALLDFLMREAGWHRFFSEIEK